MIHELQRKFILTAMAAVTVLLILLLGGLNIAYVIINQAQIKQRLTMLTRNEQQITKQQTAQGQKIADIAPKIDNNAKDVTPPDNEMEDLDKTVRHFFNPPMDEDTVMSLRFFVVQLNEEGKTVRIELGRISAVTEKQAEDYAARAMERGKTFGQLNHFIYQVVRAEEETDKNEIIVFLDIAREQHTIIVVIILSIVVAVAGWLLMLALVFFLSNKAIRPIDENIKKQKQFVTDAGHELKTPLAIIQANVDAMELINGENKWSKNIRSQTLRLTDLTQNLLTLAKMEEGESGYISTEVDVSNLVKEGIQSFKESAALKGVKIESDIASGLCVQANKEQMQRLCSILFDNAVKYCSENGRILVMFEATDHNVRLQVKNTLDELPEGEPEQLFDRFYRGDKARTQKNIGYGIGLAAAKAIVETHKGSIKAEYDGEWIVFTAKIPKNSS